MRQFFLLKHAFLKSPTTWHTFHINTCALNSIIRCFCSSQSNPSDQKWLRSTSSPSDGALLPGGDDLQLSLLLLAAAAAAAATSAVFLLLPWVLLVLVTTQLCELCVLLTCSPLQLFMCTSTVPDRFAGLRSALQLWHSMWQKAVSESRTALKC